MKLAEANRKLNRLSGIPFLELFSSGDMASIIRNKGKTGQLLELALGMHLSNTNLDFEDGELKTNKCDRMGKPLETVFIKIIYNYAVAQGYEIVGESFDDNVSGMHFNREGIDKIYEVVETGSIEAVLVKDAAEIIGLN